MSAPAEILAALQAQRTRMQDVNRLTRARAYTREQKLAKLCREFGFPLAQAEALLTPDQHGRIGYSGFEIMRLDRELRRIRRRIAANIV